MDAETGAPLQGVAVRLTASYDEDLGARQTGTDGRYDVTVRVDCSWPIVNGVRGARSVANFAIAARKKGYAAITVDREAGMWNPETSTFEPGETPHAPPPGVSTAAWRAMVTCAP